jgi:NaMN:DMB phosphoribosyltransferase
MCVGGEVETKSHYIALAVLELVLDKWKVCTPAAFHSALSHHSESCSGINLTSHIQFEKRKGQGSGGRLRWKD